MKNWQSFKIGLLNGIPIGVAYLAVSFSFGLMAMQAGLSTGQSVIMSLTNVTSAGQIAAVGIITSGGTYIELALNQLIINMRYALMGFSLSQKLDEKSPRFHRFFMAFGLTDEIFAVSSTKFGKVTPAYIYGAMLTAIPPWVIGTLLGCVAGQILPDFIISALGISMYAMLISVIITPAKHNKTLIWVVTGAMLLSTAFKYVPGLNKVSTGFVIIIVTVVVAALAAIIKPVPVEPVPVKEGLDDK